MAKTVDEQEPPFGRTSELDGEHVVFRERSQGLDGMSVGVEGADEGVRLRMGPVEADAPDGEHARVRVREGDAGGPGTARASSCTSFVARSYDVRSRHEPEGQVLVYETVTVVVEVVALLTSRWVTGDALGDSSVRAAGDLPLADADAAAYRLETLVHQPVQIVVHAVAHLVVGIWPRVRRRSGIWRESTILIRVCFSVSIVPSLENPGFSPTRGEERREDEAPGCAHGTDYNRECAPRVSVLLDANRADSRPPPSSRSPGSRALSRCGR